MLVHATLCRLHPHVGEKTRKMKQKSSGVSPRFTHHQILPRAAACIQKYVTAISPEAINAANRVKSPRTMQAPNTTSITPAAPNRLMSSTVPPLGPTPPNHPKIFAAPCEK
jgi:hypothetical protein